MKTAPIVVGVDGGPDSLKALHWAAEHAAATGAELVALTAFHVPAIVGPYAMAGWQDTDALEEQARSMLADAVRNALGEDAAVRQIVLRAHPAEAMVAASADAGLVVVGSRGLGGFRGMVLGSVSQHVVSHSRCPVVVLPTTASGQTEV